MDTNTLINQLEQEWGMVDLTGFFGKLQADVFDKEGFQRLRDILVPIEIQEAADDGDMISKRFVELTWFMPTFMRGVEDDWRERGIDIGQLSEAINFVEQRLTTILGVP